MECNLLCEPHQSETPTSLLSDHGSIRISCDAHQELNNLAAGSAFDVAAHTEALLLGRRSEVYGVSTSRVVEAVPPALSRVRINPPDATTTQLLLEYEVLGTTGLMYHALMEAGEAADKEKVGMTMD